MKYLSIILVAMHLACATPLTPATLGKDYITIRGTLASAPMLDDTKERLYIYLRVKKPESDEDYILEAVAYNPEDKDVLRRIEKKLIEVDAPVVLHVTEIKEQWQEFVEGADWLITAVGVYNPRSESREIIHATYGNSLRDAMRDVSWTGFLKEALKKGVKAANPLD